MSLVSAGIPAPIGVCYPFWIIHDVYQPLFPFHATRVLIGRIVVVRINGMTMARQLLDSQLDLRQQYADKLGDCLLIKAPCPPQGTVTFPASECIVKSVIGNDSTLFPLPSVLPMTNGMEL